MATDRQQAAKDLNAKLRLEAKLRPRVERVEREVVREVVRSLGNSRGLPDVEGFSADRLEPILLAHYEDVGEKFSKQIRGDLPQDVAITLEEEATVDATLVGFFERRAPEQAAIIAKNNRRDAERSIIAAADEGRRAVEAGDPMPGLREAALIAGAILFRGLRGRTTGIVMGETQAPAEASKLTELNTLLGNEPSVDSGQEAAPSPVMKTWVSQGDSRVRTPPDSSFDHLRADSTEVPVNQPFRVSGESLMYPGDTSLGASIGNVANCRCSSITDPDEVFREREKIAR